MKVDVIAVTKNDIAACGSNEDIVTGSTYNHVGASVVVLCGRDDCGDYGVVLETSWITRITRIAVTNWADYQQSYRIHHETAIVT